MRMPFEGDPFLLPSQSQGCIFCRTQTVQGVCGFWKEWVKILMQRHMWVGLGRVEVPLVNGALNLLQARFGNQCVLFDNSFWSRYLPVF